MKIVALLMMGGVFIYLLFLVPEGLKVMGLWASEVRVYGGRLLEEVVTILVTVAGVVFICYLLWKILAWSWREREKEEKPMVEVEPRPRPERTIIIINNQNT